MDGKGSQKRDGRRGRHHTSGSWRKSHDSSQQDRKQGRQQGNQQGNQKDHQDHQQDHQQDPVLDYPPYRPPIHGLAHQPTYQQPTHQQQPSQQQPKKRQPEKQQPVQGQAQQSARQQKPDNQQPDKQLPVHGPAQQPADQQQPTQQRPDKQQPEKPQSDNQQSDKQQSEQQSFQPCQTPNETQRPRSPKAVTSEVDALRRAIEFVGQRNAELHIQFEELKGEFSGMKEKYTILEGSIKQNIARLPGGTQLLQAMAERERQKRRLAIRNSLLIPSQSQVIPPEEKPYIESVIEFCYELLQHEVNVSNELRKELALVTAENAELIGRLESKSKSKSDPCRGYCASH
ncbi:hypothetical protein Daesc_002656 [Daldinia eschscholtzii]|uniref:Uncharacterized protein n=1 Tax=Daldinia eschscholtzii TaxID=292717 RepID=A0AAX6MR84_9PEZI